MNKASRNSCINCLSFLLFITALLHIATITRAQDVETDAADHDDSGDDIEALDNQNKNGESETNGDEETNQPEEESNKNNSETAEEESDSDNQERETGNNEAPEEDSKHGSKQADTSDKSEHEDKDGPWVGLRVMTFNTWHFGADVDNGFDKVVDNILLPNPDIVSLQEMKLNNVTTLLKRLGPKWSGVDNPMWNYPDVAIITRHKLIKESFVNSDVGVGVDIQIVSGVKASTIHFWAVHLDWQEYGPYDFCDPDKKNGRNFKYYPTRLVQMRQVTAKIDSIVDTNKDDHKPVIVAGDFNEPSHHDWVHETRHSHCGKTYAWNVSKHLTDLGYVDSFREVHPAPADVPGDTWSTVRKWRFADKNDFSVLEPQDRIDWIFTKSSRLKAVDAITFQGAGTNNQMEPNYRFNDWPSDHFGVISDLKLYL